MFNLDQFLNALAGAFNLKVAQEQEAVRQSQQYLPSLVPLPDTGGVPRVGPIPHARYQEPVATPVAETGMGRIPQPRYQEAAPPMVPRYEFPNYPMRRELENVHPGNLRNLPMRDQYGKPARRDEPPMPRNLRNLPFENLRPPMPEPGRFEKEPWPPQHMRGPSPFDQMPPHQNPRWFPREAMPPQQTRLNWDQIAQEKAMEPSLYEQLSYGKGNKGKKEKVIGKAPKKRPGYGGKAPKKRPN